mmetsp:Transcript_17770/g.25167  ORF Transcript_17770/g.25167 Transcript_17770/m.25167 type:complete len:317 (+) Transcript_17770:93-1043(+)
MNSDRLGTEVPARTIGSIVGNKRVHNQLTTSVGVKIISHIITLELHVVTELVEGGGTDHVALTINLPSDGSVLRAHFVVTGGSGGGSSVVVDVSSHVLRLINNHTTHHVGVEVSFVIHNSEDLAVHTNVAGNVLRILSNCLEDFKGKVAEHSIVERSLELVDSAAISSGGVGPVNFVGLSNFHVGAVLPFVWLSELLVLSIVVVATESTTNVLSSKITVGPLGTRSSAMGSITVLIELSIRVVLSSKMPVHVHGAHVRGLVRSGNGHQVTNIQITNISLGDVSSSLRSRNFQVGTKLVGNCELSSSAYVVSVVQES